jgi:hypothetical protein
MKRMLSGICVLVAAAFASNAIAADVKATDTKTADVAGRWQGQSWRLENGSELTLDIVACGDGWCGIRVMADDSCGGTALKINAGVVEEGNAQFEGTLKLAEATEPYIVHATVFPLEQDKPPQMQITGDTGGEFRIYRRTFPFEAALTRLSDAVCKAPQTVSSAR